MEKYLLTALFTLSACSIGGTPSSRAAIDNYTVSVGHSFSAATTSQLEGTGKVVFTALLGGANSEDSLVFSGELPFSSSSISIVSHASTSLLTDGNQLTFTPSGLGLLGEVKVDSLSPVNIDNLALNLFSSNSFAMTIDFHDLGSLLRVLIWNDTVTSFSATTADFDSITNAQPFPSTTGSGTYSGLILNNARVNKAQWGGAVLSGSLN